MPAADTPSACVACAGPNLSPVVVLNGTRTYRCRGCGCRFSYPRPPRATIDQFYDHRHYTVLDEEIVRERLELGRLSMAHRLEVARPLAGRPLARMLEIGCGPGFYVHGAVQLGIEARGIDLDPGAVEFGRSRGLALSQATIEESGFEDGKFDLVLLAQIIEHVPDPHDFLERVHRLLAPGGVVIVETPNASSLEHVHRRLFVEAYPKLADDNPGLSRAARAWLAATRPWGYLDPPRHINGFTVASLRRVLERSGFAVGRQDHYMFHDSPYSPLSSVERNKVGAKEARFRQRLKQRSWPAYAAYRLVWNPAMGALKAHCRFWRSGIGLVMFARRDEQPGPEASAWPGLSSRARTDD